MDSAEIEKRVKAELAEITEVDLQPEGIAREMSLREDLALHSLEAVTLVMDLEDEYEIELEDDEMQSLRTVGDVVDILVTKLSAA